MQQGLCALCGCTVTQSACELDHVVPVRQLFADSVQRLQALCVDCHSEKTLRESAQPTSLESRVCPGVMEAYVRSPKLPPLVFEAQGSHREKPYVGVDVVRCRRNGLANAPHPLPRGRRGARGAGAAAGLGLRGGVPRRAPGRAAAAAVCGPWLVPECFHCRDAGDVCRWDHIPLGMYARGHVWARPRPEGEEHMAKLSVNAMIGLWARRADVIYSVRSSSCQLDGPGADFTQSFCYGEGSVWDFVYTRRLLTNGTYRPIHDAVLGFEHCMVAKALDEAGGVGRGRGQRVVPDAEGDLDGLGVDEGRAAGQRDAADPRGCGGERAQQAREVLHVVPRRHVAGVACLQLVVQALRQLILGSGGGYLHASLHVPRHAFSLVRRRSKIDWIFF